MFLALNLLHFSGDWFLVFWDDSSCGCNAIWPGDFVYSTALTFYFRISLS